MHPNAEQIVAEMLAYNERFVEKAHPAFGNLPVCPFAKKARLENRLKYVVAPFSLPGVFKEIAEWLKDEESQALILVDPDRDMPKGNLDEFVLNVSLNLPYSLSLFVAHPEDTTKFHGVETRREPYPNIQVMKRSVLEKAQEQLHHSPRWYLGSQVQTSG